MLKRLKLKPSIDAVQYQFLDIAEPESVTACFDSLNARFSKIDAVVNAALPLTSNYGRKFEDVAFADFASNLTAHLGGYFNVCKEAVALFNRQGYGNIVNLGSIYGIVAPRFGLYEGTNMTKEIEYALAKAGIIHMTKYLAAYLKSKNIRVNCLSPGGVLDSQNPNFIARYNDESANKGMLDPADVSGALCYLLSEDSTHMNGHNLVLDDGFSARR